MRSLKLIALQLLVCSSFAGCGADSTEEQIIEAQVYLAEQQLDAAAIELKNALQQTPQSAEARFLLGKVYFEQGDIASAEKELVRARELDYPEEQTFPLLAQVFLALGKDAELEGLSFADLTPQAQATVQAAQGLSALSRGELQAAVDLIGQAQEKDSLSNYAGGAQARVLAVQGKLDESRIEINLILERDANYIPAWSLLGDVELQARQLDAADAAYSRAIELGEQQLGDRLKRAVLRVQRQDYDGAQQDVDILVKTAPQHPGVGYVQGLIQFYQQEFQEAVTAFAIAERDKNRYPLALLYAGTAQYMLGNKDQAEGYANLFHNIQPDNIAGRKLLATIQLGERKFGRVEELMAPVIEATPDDVGALNLLANALLGLGRTDEGIDLLNRVAELQPDSSVAQVRLGAGLLMGGEQSGGVEKLETALELNPSFQQADILLALNYMQQGEVDKAIQAAKDYRLRNPASVTPYNLLGRIYLAADQKDEAVKSFETALELEPGDPSANHNLAELAIADGDLARARSYYEAVLKQQENLLATLLKLAELDARQGREDTMVKRLRSAIEAHPQAVEPRVILARYYLSKRKPEQVAVLLNELDEEFRNMPGVLREIAQAQLAQQEFVQAEFTLNQEISLRPNDAQAHFLLASAFEGQQKREQSLVELGKSLELNPNHFGARLARARMSFAARKWKDLAPDLDVLMQLGPDHSAVLKLRAGVANEQGDVDTALALLQKNQELTQSTDGMLTLARQQAVMGNTAGALQTREGWVKDHPEDMAARTDLAMHYGNLDRIEDAISEYKIVLEKHPDNFLILNNLAWYLRDTEPDKALEYAQSAVDQYPESAEALDTLAMVQLETGDTRKAQRSMERALDKLPDNPTLLFHNARVQAAVGDKEQALATLSSILENQEDFLERGEAEALLEELSE